MLARTRGGNEVFHALKVLERLSELGLDAEALWQCRRELCQGQRKLPVLVRAAARPQANTELTRLLLEVLVTIHQQQGGGDYFLRHPCDGHRQLLRLYERWPMETHEREAVLSAIVQLQPWQALPQSLPRLFGQAPALVRNHLMQLSRRSDGWFYRWLGDRPAADSIRQARQWLIQLALLPRPAEPAAQGPESRSGKAKNSSQTEEIEA